MSMIIDCYITFAIAFMCVCLFVWAWANFKEGVKTLRWIKVKGEVVSSRIERSGTTSEFDHPTYQTYVKVKYEVDGCTYQTANVDDFIGTIESIGKPKPIPKNTSISVYYNPENPQEAIVIRESLRLSIFLGLLGIGFIMLEWHWVAKTFF